MLTHQKEGTDSPFHVQAGLAFLDLSARPTARWNVEDLFVPPSLWGAGLGGLFLDELLVQLKKEGVNRCEVTVEARQSPDKVDSDGALAWTKRTDVASRQQLNDLLAFYQRADFRSEKNCLVCQLKTAVTEEENSGG
jgi:GNAT superfamily N-acetyltransferase